MRHVFFFGCYLFLPTYDCVGLCQTRLGMISDHPEAECWSSDFGSHNEKILAVNPALEFVQINAKTGNTSSKIQIPGSPNLGMRVSASQGIVFDHTLGRTAHCVWYDLERGRRNVQIGAGFWFALLAPDLGTLTCVAPAQGKGVIISINDGTIDREFKFISQQSVRHVCGTSETLLLAGSTTLEIVRGNEQQRINVFPTIDDITSVAYHEVGKCIAVGSSKGSVAFIDSDSLIPKKTVRIHSAIETISAVGNHILVGTTTGQIVVFTLDGTEIKRINVNHTSEFDTPVMKIAGSPEGFFVAASLLNGDLLLVNFKSGDVVWRKEHKKHD